MKNFDIIIIGGGIAGYVASIRAAQLGFNTVCIDDWGYKKNKPALGGTCTNVGCIPSKILLYSSENYKNAIYNFKEHGIEIENININLKKMFDRKNKIIKKINNGILYLFKKNKIKFIHGNASFLKKEKEKYKIKIISNNNEEIITAKNIIIATGSKPRKFKNILFDEKIILSNKGGLSAIDKKTKKICIIGAGVIGLEIGSIWNRFNMEITILEQSQKFLSKIDKEISNKAYKILINQGIKILLNIKIKNIKIVQNKVLVEYKNKDHYFKKEIFDKLIISIGRIANINTLNINNINIKTDKNGFIIVDKNLQTNIKNIWAIGDVIGGNMLAHKAEKEAIKLIEYIANKDNYNSKYLIPSVIYTSPEIAWIGKNEQQLINKNINYKVGTFPFSANSKSIILGNSLGFIKTLTDIKTNKILGVHIIGPSASELIATVTTAMKFNASSNDIIDICYAHPSLSEAIKESSMLINKKSINF